MLEYDPTTDLRHYPMPMAVFGQNRYGQNLYRIVFSSSRRNLVVGEWPDGSNCARWAETYSHIQPAAWILERWLPAGEFAMCSRAEWESKFLILGPWPERGEYQHAHTFLGQPAGVEKLISWIEEGRRRRYQEHLDACRKDYEAEEKDKRSVIDAKVRDLIQPRPGSPYVSTHVQRGTKTAPILRSAEELGLPTSQKFLRVRNKRRVTFNVPIEC